MRAGVAARPIASGASGRLCRTLAKRGRKQRRGPILGFTNNLRCRAAHNKYPSVDRVAIAVSIFPARGQRLEMGVLSLICSHVLKCFGSRQ